MQSLRTVRSILRPIRLILERLLPDFTEQALRDPQTRDRVVELADAELTRQVPVARLIPKASRERLIRKTLDLVLDEIILNSTMAPLEAGSGVDGFIVSADPTLPGAGRAAVEAAVLVVLGPGWAVSEVPLGAGTFRVANPEAALSVAEAWESIHALGVHSGIIDVEPDMLLPMPVEEPPQVEFGSSFGAAEPATPGTDWEWSIDQVQARGAWKYSTDEGKTAYGEGIIIGHPDTGYTQHDEIWHNNPAQNRLRYRDGYDVWSGDDDATDPLEAALAAIFGGSFIGNPGHGTGTASVIFSAEGSGNAAHVTGAAPRAQLIPFRTAPSVVVLKQWKLAEAIRRATDKGCHVISISMGGPGWPSLKKAVRYATSSGVIVCAAAGNQVKFVVWPAAYDEVVACAGSNKHRKIWSGSSHGKDVDITAPGEDVWKASARKGQSPLNGVGIGSGTSFAVANVAGIAACWLAHWGRDWLIQTYGLGQIASVFKRVLALHKCTPIDGWKPNQYGPGIINAEELLKTPLPKPSELVTLGAAVMDSHLEQIGTLFDDIDRSTLRTGLARLLKTTEAQLSTQLAKIGDELYFHFYNDAELRQSFRTSLTGEPATFGAPAALPVPPAPSPSQNQLLRSSSPTLAAALAR
jgi:thermitase